MTIQHPDDKHLQFYVAARLDEAKEKIIEKHLARCPECSKRVSELENSLQDPLLQKVKAAAASDDDSSGTVDAAVRSSQWNQSVSNSILPGDILSGNLRLEEKLGRGGMGETWKAYDITADRFVVLKFVPGELQHLKEAMDSVRSSFQKIHALQHQHICPVYSLIDNPKHGLYIVMKYIDGMTLSEYRRRLADKKTKLSFNDIVQILWAVAKGLDYAHERKVIHRDIKPGNIMIGRKDGVQIIDFGLAEEIRTIMSQASDAVAMSSSGTRPYMAPEQWRGRIQDARTDQYALAVTAYELFAGHVPFSGNDAELLKNTVLNDLPEPIPGLPEHVNAALLKGLSKKRDDRYENCRSFVKALATKSTTGIEERNFPDGDASINDLPSDQASGENVPPVWLPDNISSMPKPPIIATSPVSKKKSLPSWVLPTISALAMLVICLICFLGYVATKKESKPEKPIAVAKKPEPKEELKEELAAEPIHVQEEKPESENEKPMEQAEENHEPEEVAKEEPQPIPPVFQSKFKNIFEAASKGTVQDIEHFLNNGTDLSIKNNNGDTLLHWASAHNTAEILEYLVSNNVDVNERNNGGMTPLHSAAKDNPNVDVLKYLVSLKTDVNARNNSGVTPLHYAARDNSNVEVLKYLVSQGADVDAKNNDSDTLLHWAAFRNTVEVLKYLVSQNVDVNAKTKYGLTPLHSAAQNNPNVDVFEYLISQKANVDARTNTDGTPLHIAAARNPNIEVLKCLISRGADANAKSTDGKKPLDLANTDEKKAILREAMIPTEAVELRRQFEEAVKQAQKPYREELEKELALAKKKDDVKLVSVLEAEQKHLNSGDAEELSTFTPEKKSLFNAKVRYKKQMEAARDNYLKEMDSLVKELVRNARTNDALIVQFILDNLRNRLNERNHLSEQKMSLIRPKRSHIAPVPVLRMTMELHADGKGRFGVSRGMSTDTLEPLFPSQAFPLSAFPKAQAFRGQNGMGRVVFDFRDADPMTTWQASGWGSSFHSTKVDAERKTLRFESSKLQSNMPGPRATFWPGKFSDFPFRVTTETVFNSKGYCPLLYIWLTASQGERSYVAMWRQGLTENYLRSHYRCIHSDGSFSDALLPNIEIGANQPVWTSFELPSSGLKNLTRIDCEVQAGHELIKSPPRLDLDVEVVLVDISGKLKATAGFTVANTNEKVTIGNVKAQTAAFRAGLKFNDEIIRFNGEKRSAEQIQKMLDTVQFGDPVTVAVIRNGEEKVFRFHAE